MNEEERKQRAREDTDKIYHSIGKFVVKFELVCHQLQTGIVCLLNRKGLQDQSVSQILVAGLTAEPLRVQYQSLMAQIMPLNSTEEKMVQDALKRFQELTSKRNDVIHGTWFIGYGNEQTTDFSKAMMNKQHKTKQGSNPKCYSYTPDDLDQLSEEADKLKEVFARILPCIAAPDLSIEKQLEFIDGQVTAKKGLASDTA